MDIRRAAKRQCEGKITGCKGRGRGKGKPKGGKGLLLWGRGAASGFGTLVFGKRRRNKKCGELVRERILVKEVPERKVNRTGEGRDALRGGSTTESRGKGRGSCAESRVF